MYASLSRQGHWPALRLDIKGPGLLPRLIDGCAADLTDRWADSRSVRRALDLPPTSRSESVALPPSECIGGHRTASPTLLRNDHSLEQYAAHIPGKGSSLALVPDLAESADGIIRSRRSLLGLSVFGSLPRVPPQNCRFERPLAERRKTGTDLWKPLDIFSVPAASSYPGFAQCRPGRSTSSADLSLRSPL